MRENRLGRGQHSRHLGYFLAVLALIVSYFFSFVIHLQMWGPSFQDIDAADLNYDILLLLYAIL